MDVFVSYSGKDTEFVKKMCSVLKSHGISYWAEYENEDSGDNSAEKTVSRISEAKVLLVFVSKNANESKRVMNELNCASMCNKPILPVVIDDVELSPVFEYYMANANRLNYSQSSDFVEKFVGIIRSVVGIETVLPAEEKAEQAPKQNSLENKNRKNKKLGVVISVIVVLAVVIVAIFAFPKGTTAPPAKNEFYIAAEAALASGDTAKAAILFGKAANAGYADARERSFALWDEVALRETVSAGLCHTILLKTDGTVVATKFINNNPKDTLDYATAELVNRGQCEVSDWTDIVAVSAGDLHTVCLKYDGTVVAVGGNDCGQCDVSTWTDIVAVSAGDLYTVGLKSDGTVIHTIYLGTLNWEDIVAVSAGDDHTVGLKSDGTVVAVGDNEHGQCDVSAWTDIVAISAGEYYTVGLKSDGTVVATKYIDDPDDVYDDYEGQCNVGDWTDIVAVSAHKYHTVGLKSDGTVVTAGSNSNGRCDVSTWTDIVAVSVGVHHTVGLKSDGTVVAVGSNHHGQCDVSGWTNIKQP